MATKHKLTLSEKMQLIRENENNTLIAEYIENYEHNENSTKKRNFRDELNQQLDQKVYEWFVIQRSKNIPISGPLIQAQAREIRQQLGGANLDELKASNGWLEKFRARHNIQYRAICGESTAEDIANFSLLQDK
ncbi:unnamed protein product [Rotaria socialis]|uniref:HTH CENPB-type domain-containing protein n=1 Tax=Rotaria socialis TaxID=392032 RepID=A0A821IZF8_9BILA|nr:unnamed protein product [Rotaria socialis]CAF4711305.1 unnamed protein product [Rotaria socialis]